MAKQKKKTAGRPKKEFISHKPKTKIQDRPWRPKKDSHERISPLVGGFVEHAVGDSKKKDLIILLLFLLSFLLFLVSLYFTFIKKNDISPKEPVITPKLPEITNVQTGNITYTSGTLYQNNDNASFTPEQQVLVDFYTAINQMNMENIYNFAEAHLEKSNVFKTYYSTHRLQNFVDIITEPKITISNIEETITNSTNPNIKNYTYTIEYTLASNQQKFTEEWSTVLIFKWDSRKIGKLMCETKWCSTMPFFNPEKYKN